jgi:hypothetical protein
VFNKGLELVRDVCIDVVIPEIVLLQHGIVQILGKAQFLHLFRLQAVKAGDKRSSEADAARSQVTATSFQPGTTKLDPHQRHKDRTDATSILLKTLHTVALSLLIVIID